MYGWVRAGIAASVLAGALGAQPATPAEPRFEVVSIHAVPPNAPVVFREQGFTPVLPGGQYVHSRANLISMIAFAYRVENPSVQLVGLPDWAKRAGYSVSAKPAEGFPRLPPAENEESVRGMLRAVLEERFHLKVHTETRQERVYQLAVGKGGLKVKEVDPPVPPEKEGFVNAALGDSGGRIIGKKSTMAGMARMLIIFVSRPVIDATGLKGYYDFDVKWNAPQTADGERPADGLGAAGEGLLISVLQDRFGLHLASGTGPVKYWVVDHVEPPTEN